MELDLTGSSLEYQPGDSISMLPENEDSMVNALLDRLGFKGEDQFYITALEGKGQSTQLSHIPRPCTVRQALQRCDVTSIPRYESI